MTEQVKIEDVKKGDFVRRKADSKTTYTTNGYCRFNKRYEINDWDDINRWMYLKKGTLVYIGFTF